MDSSVELERFFKERMKDISSPRSERVGINDKQVASIVVSRDDNVS